VITITLLPKSAAAHIGLYVYGITGSLKDLQSLMINFNQLRQEHPDVNRLGVSEYMYIPHSECPSPSHDTNRTRKVLKVKRNPNGLYAKCMRCDEYGYDKTRQNWAKLRKEGKEYEHKQGTPFKLPEIEYEWSKCPPQHVVWLNKAGLSERLCERYSIGYSSKLNRTVVPILDNQDILLGYQTRRIHSWDDGPKYKTYLNRNLGGIPFWSITARGEHNTLVIVEDILSAIRIAPFADSVALLTATPKKQLLDTVVKNQYKRAFIWLDDDNTQVKKSQRRMATRLRLVIPDVQVIRTNGRDPKEHTDDEISSLLHVERGK